MYITLLNKTEIRRKQNKDVTTKLFSVSQITNPAKFQCYVIFSGNGHFEIAKSSKLKFSGSLILIYLNCYKFNSIWPKYSNFFHTNALSILTVSKVEFIELPMKKIYTWGYHQLKTDDRSIVKSLQSS